MTRIFLTVLASVVLPSVIAHAAPTVVSTCGETVTDAVLATDLDCSAFPGYSVTIAKDGRLDLAGHELVSGPGTYGFGGAVRCLGNCSIVGGGGAITSGVAFDHGNDITPTGVIVPYPGRGRVSIEGATLSGYWMAAIASRLSVTNSIFTDNLDGCRATRLHISASSFSVSHSWYYEPAHGRHVYIEDSSFEGGGGVGFKHLELYRSTVTAMNGSGLGSRYTGSSKVYVEDSIIDGNCVSSLSQWCGDIEIGGMKAPVLVGSTCSTSLRIERGDEAPGTWGVCSLD